MIYYSLHSNIFLAILASKGKGNIHRTYCSKYSDYFVSENKNININIFILLQAFFNHHTVSSICRWFSS